MQKVRFFDATSCDSLIHKQTHTMSVAVIENEMKQVLEQLGIGELSQAYSTGVEWGNSEGAEVREIYSPVDGELIGKVQMATEADYEQVITTAQAAF